MRIHPDVVFRQLGDGSVLVHLATNEIFELNATGAAIWALVERGASADAIVADLVATFDVPPDVARDDCEHLLADLHRRGLLVP